MRQCTLIETDVGRGIVRFDLSGRSSLWARRYVSRAFTKARQNNYDLWRWCDYCCRWITHEQGQCLRLAAPWAKCVCEVHMCYDARALGIGLVQGEASVYRDFVEGEG